MTTLKETQRNKVLKLLQEAGNSGVESYDLTYVHNVKQAPTRIAELIDRGYQITSMPSIRNKRSVIYVLNHIPEKLRKPLRYEFIGDKAVPVYQ